MKLEPLRVVAGTGSNRWSLGWISMKSSLVSLGVEVGGSRVESRVPEGSVVTGARWTVGDGRRARRSGLGRGVFVGMEDDVEVEGGLEVGGFVDVEGGLVVFVAGGFLVRRVRLGTVGVWGYGGGLSADKAVFEIGALGKKSGALVLKENG